jgi:hypothetical protein
MTNKGNNTKVKILTEKDIRDLIARKKAVEKYLKGNITKEELDEKGVKLSTPLSIL